MPPSYDGVSPTEHVACTDRSNHPQPVSWLVSASNSSHTSRRRRHDQARDRLLGTSSFGEGVGSFGSRGSSCRGATSKAAAENLFDLYCKDTWDSNLLNR